MEGHYNRSILSVVRGSCHGPPDIRESFYKGDRDFRGPPNLDVYRILVRRSEGTGLREGGVVCGERESIHVPLHCRLPTAPPSLCMVSREHSQPPSHRYVGSLFRVSTTFSRRILPFQCPTDDPSVKWTLQVRIVSPQDFLESRKDEYVHLEVRES